MTILASVNNKTVMPGITPIADVPDRPTIGTATAGEASASVTFTASTTGGTPTTFTATSSPGSITGTASSSPITMSGLTPSTSYTFTVTAGNSTGTSPASSASNSVTPTVPIDGAYDALATISLSATTSSITFAGIPSGYKHLQLRYSSRCDRASLSDGLSIRFNGDSSSTYSRHTIYADGSVGIETSTSQTLGNFAVHAAASSGTNVFGVGVIDILDYASVNKTKTVRAVAAVDGNAAFGDLRLGSSLWFATPVAITSITLLAQSGSASFVSGTSYALYGVK